MRISDWSSDVCSSDLWSVFLVSRGTAARRGKKVGQGRCGVPDQRSGLLTDGAFREAVLVRPATGKRRMARPSATKKHRRARILRYRTAGSSRLAPIDDRSEEHTSELPSLMRISYAAFCLKKQH